MKRRKTWQITKVIMLMGIFLLPALPMASQTGKAESARKIELRAQLQLTEEQEAEIERIFKMAQSQAELDRQNFKGNTVALIEAAKRRRAMTDSLVDALLKPEQKALFKNYQEKRKQDEEFFILKEGLSLTEEQSFQVKNILAEYRRLFDPEQEQRRAQLEESGDQLMGYPGTPGYPGSPGTRPGEIPGTLPGRTDIDRRGSYGPGHGKDMETRLLDALKDVDEKIAKKINPLLTKEQQKMYVTIRKMQQEELQKRLAEQLNQVH